jgi:hypothetical protein
VSDAEYAGMMEQVVLTIDSDLRKDAGLPPLNLTTVCIHSKPITEECPECIERWGQKAAFLGEFCARCGRKRAYHLSFDDCWWCDPEKQHKFEVVEGESREEFERDRMGQTGEDNARRMRVKSALIGSTSGTVHFAGGKGPHLLRDRKGNTAYCGGPGACEFCERGLPPSGDHHAEQVEEIPWIGGNRDLDPNNPEDVAAWKERDRQAAAMLEPSHLATNVVYAPPETNFPVKGFTEEPPKVDPAAFEFLDETRKAADMACGADPAVLAKANSDPHAKSIAGHSHVLSSADPKPRIADTSMEMPKPKMIDSPKTAVAAAHEALAKKKPAEIVRDMQKKRARKCKFCEKPLERWSATMMRCTGCGRNEAV